MKKITRVGWIGKNTRLEDVFHYFLKSVIAEKKGVEWEWPEQYWPLRRIRITVEEVK